MEVHKKNAGHLCGGVLALEPLRKKVARMGGRCQAAISHSLHKTETSRLKKKKSTCEKKKWKTNLGLGERLFVQSNK